MTKTLRKTKQKTEPANQPGVTRGILISFCENLEPAVDFYGNPTGAPVLASSTIRLHETDLGKDVILVFEDGDQTRPVILGVVRPPREPMPKELDLPVEIKTDGERLQISARQEIELRCGRSSITLTADGKVLIRGAYVSSRSSGANRIKGGSVHLN